MDNNTDELEMACRCYGYGRWEAPYWFLGPEQGKGSKETNDNAPRLEAWLQLGAKELNDCYDFHRIIGEQDWHQEKPNLQRTWRPLILLLKTFLNESKDKDSLRAYQRDRWGRLSGGETCVIELSGRPARSFNVPVDREQFRQERISIIRQRMHTHRPKFVVMYGMNGKVHWENIAGCKLVCDDVVKLGSTMIVFAPHPNTRGRKDTDWEKLGMKLRREAECS